MCDIKAAGISTAYKSKIYIYTFIYSLKRKDSFGRSPAQFLHALGSRLQLFLL